MEMDESDLRQAVASLRERGSSAKCRQSATNQALDRLTSAATVSTAAPPRPKPNSAGAGIIVPRAKAVHGAASAVEVGKRPERKSELLSLGGGSVQKPWVRAQLNEQQKAAVHAAEDRIHQVEKARARRAAQDAEKFALMEAEMARRAELMEAQRQQRRQEFQANRVAVAAHQRAVDERVAMERTARERRTARAMELEECRQREAAERKLAAVAAEAEEKAEAEPARRAAKARVREMAEEQARQQRAAAVVAEREAAARLAALDARAATRAAHLDSLERNAVRRREALSRQVAAGTRRVLPDAVKRAAARHDFATVELVQAKLTPAERDRELLHFLDLQRQKKEARWRAGQKENREGLQEVA